MKDNVRRMRRQATDLEKLFAKTFRKGRQLIRTAKIWNTDNTNACLNGEQQELSNTDRARMQNSTTTLDSTFRVS